MNTKELQTSEKQEKCKKQHRTLPSIHAISNQEMKDATGGKKGMPGTARCAGSANWITINAENCHQ